MKIIRLPAVMLVSLLITGCFSTSDRAFRPVTHSINAQLPELQLTRVFSLSIGRSALALVDVVASTGEFDFSDLDKVQIAVYETGFANEVSLSNFNVEAALVSRDKSLNWQTIVKVRDVGEHVWIVAGINESKGRVDAISIVALENSELVLVNVDGDLLRMLEFALEPVQGRKGVPDVT